MKKLFISLLMVGYLALVPFCLFGGAMMASAQPMDMGLMSPMQGMNNCGIPAVGCSMTSGAMGSFMHHVEMYLSLTNTAPSALGFFVLIALLLFTTVFLVFKIWRLSLPAQTRYLPRYLQNRRAREDGQVQSQSIFLRWLSLFESSPNFV